MQNALWHQLVSIYPTAGKIIRILMVEKINYTTKLSNYTNRNAKCSLASTLWRNV